MKTSMLFLALLTLTGCDVGGRNPTIHNAKFVLLSGENTLLGTGPTGASLKHILRMDTETGQTWMLIEGNGPTYWTEINEQSSVTTSK